MNIFTVSFFGHRKIDNPCFVDEKLEKIVRELILKKEYLEFLVGRDGEFDQLVAATIRKCKNAMFR